MEVALQYFKQTEKVLDANEFADTEEYDLFMQNVFAEVEGLEYRLACSHDGSGILEKILKCASGFQLRVFFEKVRGRFFDMCCHRYASHVVETWVRQAAAKEELADKVKTEAEEEERNDDHLPSTIDQLYDVSQLIIEFFIQLAENDYGSHVVRLFIKLWANKLDGYSINLCEGNDYLTLLIDHLLSLPKEVFNMKNATVSKQFGLVLQVLLPCLSSSSLAKIQNLVFPDLLNPEESIKKGHVMSICDHQSGSRFMEVFINTLDSASSLAFLNKVIRPFFTDLMDGQNSNFVLQCFISNCPNIAQFEMILPLVKEHASDILAKQRHGILLRLSSWVRAHEQFISCAEVVIGIVYGAFGAQNPKLWKNLFKALYSLKNISQVEKEQHTIQAAGCQLLQDLIYFPAHCTKPVIDSFLDMSVGELVSFSCHANGSRAVEAIFMSHSVSASVKQRTIRKLRDHVDILALNQFGSHVVDRCFQAASIELRQKIGEKLVTHKTKLEDSQYGRLVLRNCQISNFERNQDYWKSAQDSSKRKRSMFADILDDNFVGTALVEVPKVPADHDNTSEHKGATMKSSSKPKFKKSKNKKE